jgi:transketolase
VSATIEPPQLYDCRDAFAATLEDLAEHDERIVVVCNDSVASSKLSGFQRRFPDRLVNVGIAEQTMVGVAAGLASGAKRPFVASASCFLTARALEQIQVDLAYTNADVTLCGMSPGVAYGEFGPTHHSLEDVAWLRAIDNMVVIVPSDPAETEQALRASLDHDGPVFVRVSRMGVPAVNAPDYRFAIGRAVRIIEGSDLTIIANGTVVTRSLAAAQALAADGLTARVLSMPTVDPLDINEVMSAADETQAILTVEEHSVRGGLGSAVAEAVVGMRPVPMRLLGFPGFAPTGSATWLLDHFGLNAAGIEQAARDLLERAVQ